MTACVCVDASGKRYPTMYALKGKVKPKFFTDCDETVAVIMTEKGYFDDNRFYLFAVHLVKFIPDDGKWRVLILDRFCSHVMCYDTLRVFLDHLIHVVCMPSHTSSLLQPLDVSCFGPVKDKFQKDLSIIQQGLGRFTISNSELPGIFEVSLAFGCTAENIVIGFSACGIWPLSTTWLKKNKHKFKQAEDLNNNKMDNLSVKEATHVEMEDMMQSFCGLLASAMQENYGNSGMAPATVAKINKQFSELQTFFVEKVEPTLGLMKFAFGGPENPKACKKIPVGHGTKSTNSLGESNAQAKWLTTIKRMGDLKVCTDKLIEKKEGEALNTHAKKLAQLDKERAKLVAIQREEPLTILLTSKNYMQEGDGLTVAILKKFITNNKQVLSTLQEAPLPTISKMKRIEMVNLLISLEVDVHHAVIDSL